MHPPKKDHFKLNNKPKSLGKKAAELAAELRRNPEPVVARPIRLVIPDAGVHKEFVASGLEDCSAVHDVD